MPRLLFQTKLLGQTAAAYPDLTERDPAKKTVEYIAQCGQAHIADYQTCGNLGWWGNSELSDRLAYAQGRQDPAKYRRMSKDNPRLDKQASKLDMRILKVVPKYIKSVSGLLDQADYTATATPFDELAKDLKKDYEAGLRAQMENGAKLAELGINMSPDGKPAPIDEDEIQLRMLEYKNEEAARLESKLTEGISDCNYVQLAHELDNDNIIFGRACIYHYVQGKHIIPQRIEPWRLFLLPSRYEDFRDMRAGAFTDEISIGQLRQEAGDDLSDEEIKQIATNRVVRAGQTWRQNANLTGGDYGRALNSTLVTVIRFGFMSYNQVPGQAGYWAWYEGVLVPETQFYYNCKMGYNQLYDMENPGAVIPRFVPVIPDLIAGYSVSVVDEVMSPADFVQRQWIKLQDTLNRSVPPGYAYDMDRIEEVALTQGKKMSKEDVIEMFERTGRWLHNGVTIDGTKDGNTGVRQLVNGIPAEVITIWDLIIKGIDLIERMTGINGSVSAGNAGSRVAVGGLEIAKEGAVNALKFLFVAQQSLFERCCRVMAIHYRQMEILERGVEQGWGAHRFRMSVEQLPTKEEKDKFMTVVNAAVERGVIDVIDAAMIEQVRNPRMGMIYLAARAKRKAADKAAADKANIDATTQQQAAVAQQKLAELAQTTQMQNAHELALQKQKDEAATQRAVLLEKIRMDGQTQIEYYRALSSMHTTALAGSWQAALKSLPAPTGGEGGAAATATNAATLNALMPGMAPSATMMPPPAPTPAPPAPTPDEIALEQMMGGPPQAAGNAMAAPADAGVMAM